MLLENGSEIKPIKQGGVVRGNRSKLVSFYCPYCDIIHVDYPIKDVLRVEDLLLCKNILSDEEFIVTP